MTASLPTCDEFRDKVAKYRLKDVTEEEYQDHVVKHPELSWNSWITRIRNARRLKRNVLERKMMIGFPLGGRDFTYKGIDKVRSQIVPFMELGGEIHELSLFEPLKGEHGRKMEIEVEISESESDGKKYENHVIRSQRILEGKFNVSSLGDPRRVSDLDDGDKYSMIDVMGKISGIYREKMFENGSDSGDTYPIDYNGSPTMSVVLWDEGTSLGVHLGPNRIAKQLLQIEDFDLEKCETIDDFVLNFKGRWVRAMGRLNSYDEGETNYAHMQANAIWEIEPPDWADEDDDVAPARATPSLEEASSPPPAPADVAATAAAITTGVKKAYAVLGDAMTIEAIRKAKYVPENAPDEFVQMAINMTLAGSGSAPSPPAPTPTEEHPMDTSLINKDVDNIVDAIVGAGKDMVQVMEICEIMDMSPSKVKKIAERAVAAGVIYSPKTSFYKIVDL